MSKEKELGEYKVLMHDGSFVDTKMLQRGIYSCEKPFLETVKNMKEYRERAEKFLPYMPEVNTKAYLKNLSLCQLVRVKLTIVEE